jgi:holo-[acyl-carrier protein] synthase
MIIAMGTDIIEINRIEQAAKNNPKFISRILTHREITVLASKSHRSSSLAASFAAKEAVSKLLGTGIGEVSWHDIEILNNSKGAPYVLLGGKAREISVQMGIDKIFISITHDKQTAFANVIGEKMDKGESCQCNRK